LTAQFRRGTDPAVEWSCTVERRDGTFLLQPKYTTNQAYSRSSSSINNINNNNNITNYNHNASMFHYSLLQRQNNLNVVKTFSATHHASFALWQKGV